MEPGGDWNLPSVSLTSSMLFSMVETNAEVLLRAIRTTAHPLDDDELSQRTSIRPRQTVNQTLRRLAQQGVVRRAPGPDGKIVTTLAEPSTADGSRSDVAADSAPASPIRDSAEASASNSDHALEHCQRESPAGSSAEQRAAERVMLDLLSARIGAPLDPARIALPSGTRVEVDGADPERTILVECWAHQGLPKGGQKHKVLTDALKLTWIASTMYPRPRLTLCMSDPLAAAPFVSPSKSWAAQALIDLGIRVEIVDLPPAQRERIREAQLRQFR